MPNFIACSSGGNHSPSRRRLFAGMHTTALTTGARAFVGIEGRKKRRQILDEVGGSDLDAVDELPALEAKPFEPVLVARCAGGFRRRAQRSPRSGVVASGADVPATKRPPLPGPARHRSG